MGNPFPSGRGMLFIALTLMLMGWGIGSCISNIPYRVTIEKKP